MATGKRILRRDEERPDRIRSGDKPAYAEQFQHMPDVPVRHEWVDPDDPLTWSRPTGWSGATPGQGRDVFLRPEPVIDYTDPLSGTGRKVKYAVDTAAALGEAAWSHITYPLDAIARMSSRDQQPDKSTDPHRAIHPEGHDEVRKQNFLDDVRRNAAEMGYTESMIQDQLDQAERIFQSRDGWAVKNPKSRQNTYDFITGDIGFNEYKDKQSTLNYDRPLWQQVASGLLDPLVVTGTVKGLVTGAVRGAARGKALLSIHLASRDANKLRLAATTRSLPANSEGYKFIDETIDADATRVYMEQSELSKAIESLDPIYKKDPTPNQYPMMDKFGDVPEALKKEGPPLTARTGPGGTDIPGELWKDTRTGEVFVTPPIPGQLRRPGEPFGWGSEAPWPRQSDMWVDMMFDKPSYEMLDQAIMRKLASGREHLHHRMDVIMRGGNAILKRAGLDPDNLTREQIMPVLEALQGFRTVEDLPENLHETYHSIRTIMKVEEADTLWWLSKNQVAKPVAASVQSLTEGILNNPEYFIGAWNRRSIDKVKTAEQLNMADKSRPSFTYQKLVEMNFMDLVNAGAEPLQTRKGFANPFDLAVIRLLEGSQMREQSTFVNNMLKLKNAVVVEGGGLPIPPGWVNVGLENSWFGSKKILNSTTGKWENTRTIAMPSSYAKVFEDMFIESFDDLATAGGKIAGKIKKGLFFGTGFQHIDVGLIRGGASLFNPVAWPKGGPFKAPAYMAQLLETMILPHSQRKLADYMGSRAVAGTHKFIDEAGVAHELDISWSMLRQEGLSLGQDPAFHMLRQNLKQFTEELTEGAAKKGVPRRLLEGALKYWEGSLFDAAYPISQKVYVENVGIPIASYKLGTSASPRAVAAQAAEQANLWISSQPHWQTVFKDQSVRGAVHLTIYSLNEIEMPFRWALRAQGIEIRRAAMEQGIKRGVQIGPVKIARNAHQEAAITQVGGLFIWLTVLANSIQLSTTGKLLEPSQYNPIVSSENFLGYDYNPRFMSVEIPFLGRNRTSVFLDLVGQHDTIFKGVMNPLEALTSRLNIPFKFVKENLVDRRTYKNEDIAQSGDKETDIWRYALKMVTDVLPVGMTQLTDLARMWSSWASERFTMKEPRLGPLAVAIQAAGLNLRGESNNEIKVKAANEMGMTREDSPEFYGQPITDQDQLTPSQRDEVFKSKLYGPELELRNAEAIMRNDRYAISRQGKADALSYRMAAEEQLLEKYVIPQGLDVPVFNGKIMREEYRGIQEQYLRELAKEDTFIEKLDVTPVAVTLPVPGQPWRDTRTGTDGLPELDGPRALAQFYALFDASKNEMGLLDWELYEDYKYRMETGEGISEIPALRQGWSEWQLNYIENNTNLSEHHPEIQRMLDEIDSLKPFWRERNALLEGIYWENPGLKLKHQKYQGTYDKKDRDGQRFSNRDLGRLLDELLEFEIQYLNSNPGIDVLLYRWGYKENLRSAEARQAYDRARY